MQKLLHLKQEEKQKIFFFRISLSDDKEALEMKQRLMDATRIFGVDGDIDSMDAFFEKLDNTIKELERSIDKKPFLHYNTHISNLS